MPRDAEDCVVTLKGLGNNKPNFFLISNKTKHIFKWIVISKTAIELTCVTHNDPNCFKDYILNKCPK